MPDHDMAEQFQDLVDSAVDGGLQDGEESEDSEDQQSESESD